MIVEKREEPKVFRCVGMCLGEKLERNERESAQKSTPKLPKILFFVLQNEGSRSIHSRNLALQLLVAAGHLCSL